jgi:hypothetical protein
MYWRWYIIATVMSWWFIGWMRAGCFGWASPQAFLRGILAYALGSALLFPYLWLMGVGALNLPGRLSALRAWFSLIICIVLVEVFASAQELLVLREHGRSPIGEVWLRRWPPFHAGKMFYSPGFGWFARTND